MDLSSMPGRISILERPSGVKSVTSFQGTIGTTNAEGRALS